MWLLTPYNTGTGTGTVQYSTHTHTHTGLEKASINTTCKLHTNHEVSLCDEKQDGRECTNENLSIK